MSRYTKYNRAKYGKYEPGKIQCPLCDSWYKKLCSHVVQRHNMTSRDFKIKFGYPTTKGVVSADTRSLASRRNKENSDEVVKINLIEKGKPTRLKKGNQRAKKISN